MEYYHNYTASGKITKARKTLKEEGAIGLARKFTMSWLWKKNILYFFFKYFRNGKSFNFKSHTLEYFFSRNNATFTNERAIEIPIAAEILKAYEGRTILEVGNVLGNYINFRHDIVDKYETGEGIFTQDILNFPSEKKYDLILSISTIEHIGYDEEEKDPSKITKVFAHLQKLLNKHGRIFFTVPLGHNPHLDNLLREKTLGLNEQYLYHRISWLNKWAQVPVEELSLQTLRYNYIQGTAEWLFIGAISKRE